MSASSPAKVVKVEVKKGVPANQIFADRYFFEQIDDFTLIHFGRAGQTCTYASVSLSAQVIADASTPIKGFIEKLRPPKAGGDFERRDLVTSNALIPADMIHVSHRGPEGELIFALFSLHDFALSGASMKSTKAEAIIEAAPVLLVRCPLPMIQSLFLKLLSTPKK